MSAHLAIIPARAVTDDRVGSAALRVLLALGTYTDRKGWCRVKQVTIADDLGIGRTAIAKHVAELERLGYVQAKRTGRSSQYRVVLDAVDEAAPLSPHGTSPPPPDVPPGDIRCHPQDGTSDVPPGDFDRTVTSNDVPERKPHPSLFGDASRSVDTHARAATTSNGNGDDPGFAAFWAAYPRKVAKGQARTAWRAALAHSAPEAIVEGARRLAADPNLPRGDEASFVPHPATWLRGERWDDGPLPARTNGRNGHAPPPRGRYKPGECTDRDPSHTRILDVSEL